jgi:hypothetical protein
MFNTRWKARHVASAFQPMLVPVAFETVSSLRPYSHQLMYGRHDDEDRSLREAMPAYKLRSWSKNFFTPGCA